MRKGILKASVSTGGCTKAAHTWNMRIRQADVHTCPDADKAIWILCGIYGAAENHRSAVAILRRLSAAISRTKACGRKRLIRITNFIRQKKHVIWFCANLACILRFRILLMVIRRYVPEREKCRCGQTESWL